MTRTVLEVALVMVVAAAAVGGCRAKEGKKGGRRKDLWWIMGGVKDNGVRCRAEWTAWNGS